MPKLTPSPESQARIERLFDNLLALATDSFTSSSQSTCKFSIRLSGEDSASLKLIVKTELRFVVELVFPNSRRSQFRQERDRQKSQVRHDLRLLENIGILEDHRIKTQGCSIWHFSLKLWSINPTKNRDGFRLEWQRYKTRTNRRSKTKPRQEPERDVINKDSYFPRRQDWGNAPDLPNFHGRVQELTTLQQWIVEDRCRLVGIVGMAGSGKTQLSVRLGKGGIGKTDLSVQLARGIQHQFEYVIWRSLLNAPTFADLLSDWVKVLSDQQDVTPPESSDAQIDSMLHYLQQHRCLIVLDNLESILQGGNQAGAYRPGYEAYGKLFRKVAEVPHQSCLLITSREKPSGLSSLVGRKKPARFFALNGLTKADGRAIFNDIGEFSGSSEEWRSLITLYNGNPLALETAAYHIKEVYGGSLTQVLQDDKPLFADIHALLTWHLKRLSDAEAEILYWLAINREAVTIAELREDLVSLTAKAKVTETVRSLRRRLPIDTSEAGMTLQPMLMEYVTEQLVEQAYQEILSTNINVFNRYALLKATAKEYLRESQNRVILQPILERLLDALGDRPQLKYQLDCVLDKVRSAPAEDGYATGNIINLLRHAQIDLNGYDFSGLTIWQAYLQRTPLQNANLSNATLANTVFTKPYAHIMAVAFSPDGTLFAAGDTRGDIHIWDTTSGTPLHTLTEQTNWINSLAFSPDSQRLASSGFSYDIKIWNPRSGQCLKTLAGHDTGSWSVQFSSDSTQLASASIDGVVRLWDVATEVCIKTFTEHQHALYGVAFHPTAPILASSSQDATIKLWDLTTGRCVKTLRGHRDGIRSVAFSPCGQYLASSGVDHTVRLWDPETGDALSILKGHTGEVYCVAFSPDGRAIASSSDDGTVRLWDVETGHCLNSLLHPSILIMSVAYSPDGHTVACSNDTQGVRTWDTRTGRCLQSLSGNVEAVRGLAFIRRQPQSHLGGGSPRSQLSPQLQLISTGYFDAIRVWDLETGRNYDFKESAKTFHSVAVSPDQQLLATGSRDQTMRLWDAQTLQYLKQFVGHTDGIWQVAFNFDGTLLASASFDQTIKVWCPRTGSCLQTLVGHNAGVWSIAWHPQKNLLVSGSIDQTIRLWDASTGECIATLLGHKNGIRSVDISPDGSLVASGSLEGTIKLWDVNSGRCLDTLTGHTNFVWYVAFNPDGHTLASGGFDQTIRLWEIQNRQCLHVLQGHIGSVEVLVFSPDGTLLASSGDDGITRLWDVKTRKLYQTLRVPNPYEGTKITGVRGLAKAQMASLRSLGAS